MKLYVFYLCLMARTRGWLADRGYNAMTAPEHHFGHAAQWGGFREALSMYRDGKKIWAIRSGLALYVYPMTYVDIADINRGHKR